MSSEPKPQPSPGPRPGSRRPGGSGPSRPDPARYRTGGETGAADLARAVGYDPDDAATWPGGEPMMIMDAGYKTPAIAHLLLEDGIQPLFPYKRPMTKEGFFKKYEYAYDEYYDCYICPGNQVLKYSTTNRDGYREYKSCGLFCSSCPYLHQCTESKDHVKLITRHVWEEYMEKAEEIRHTIGNKEIYQQRKETIERLFGTAKEQHGFRYTQYIGKARMEMKAGLTFACMNLKKLAKILEIRESNMKEFWSFLRFLRFLLKQRLFTEKWCWG